jgi:hypothetical protein
MLWLFVPALLYAVVHRAAAGQVEAPAYAMRFDLSMARTFWNYLVWARGIDYDPEGRLAGWFWNAGTVAILLGLVSFTASRVRRGERVALFYWIWFLALLAPVLPLSLHLTDYYLILPVIGLSILGAWGLTVAWRSRNLYRAAAAALLAIYWSALPAAWAATKSRYEMTRRIENLALGAVRARELHPDQIILLTGVDDALFWNGIVDHPFRVVGVSDVYIAPNDAERITPHPELGNVSEFVLPEPALADGLRKGHIVVYSAEGGRLRNVTAEFTRRADTQAAPPARVDVANPLLAPLLGEGWYQLEEKHRWMGTRASLRIGGPKKISERLYVSGYCPPQQVARGPLPLAIRVDGEPLPGATISAAGEFAFDFALPPSAAGKTVLELAVELPRAFIEEGEDGRRLGLVFGVFEIR